MTAPNGGAVGGAALKLFLATYNESFGWGAYTTHQYAIVANSEQEALGLALEAEPATQAAFWSMVEINPGQACAHHIATGGT